VRVLQLFHPVDGGVPEHVRVVSESLVARGHAIVAGGPPGAAPRPAIEAHSRYVPLPLVGHPSPRADLVAYRHVRDLLATGRFDLLHAHDQKAGLVGRIAAHRTGVPAVYTPHLFVYRTQRRRPRRGAHVRHHVNLAVERRLGRHTAMIVACAEDERRAALADRIVPAERVEVVLYGVAPDLSLPPDPELMEFRGDGPLLGFVAGLRDQKGLPTLLEALERLATDGRAPRFAIVGNGPLREEVAERIERGRLRESTLLVPFAGRVEPYLRALDGYVLPSYWEGMPIAVLEAMAAGLPVVASAVDGTPEAVSHERTGFLVPVHDAGALALRMGQIAGEPELRARMGRAAQEEAAARFTVPRMVDELETLYRRVAAPTVR